MAKKLTALAVVNLKPRAERYEVADASGLRVVVFPSGKRSYVVRFRRPQDGRTAKHTLVAKTLAEARVEAATALLEVAQGRDPAKARAEAKLAAAVRRTDAVAAIAESFLAREGSKLRTLAQRRRLFERFVYPALGDRPISEVKRSDVVKLLDTIEDGSGPRQADIVLAALSRLFYWHAARTDDFSNPLTRGMGRAKPAAERARDRVLSDDELRRVWKASLEMHMYGALIRFLLLTAARRGEAAEMLWSELNGAEWTLPATRNKTKIDLLRPLSAAALALLVELPRANNSRYVFCSLKGRSPMSQFSRDKPILDKRSGVRNWRIHDLRRTARSLMSRAGVRPDIAERALGHVVGNAVERTYDRHRYLDELRHAYEQLAALVQRIIEPQADNVVPLHG